MNKNITTKILNVVLIIGIVITSLLMLVLPFITAASLKVSQVPTGNDFMFYSVLISLYAGFTPYLVALFKLKTLTSLVLKNTPFSRKSVNALKTISICAFSEIILFILCANIIKHTFVEFESVLLTVPTVLIGFVCVTLGLLFAILANLFNNALELKEENDMTI